MNQILPNESFGVLEFDKILGKIVEEAYSPLAREKLYRLPFHQAADALGRELALVSEMRDCLQYDGLFPLDAFPDFGPDLKKAEVAGAFLHPKTFLAIHDFLQLIQRLKSFFSGRAEKYALLQKCAQRLVPLPELEREIRRTIGTSGDVLDRASEKLHRIRQEIRRKESDVRKRLEAVLREMVSHGFAQEDALVLRDDRLVIPMKESSQHRLKGMVVDESASGMTLFMEPLEAVEMNNAVRKLKVQEKLEEEEILKELTGMVRESRQSVEENMETAAELDAVSARARFSLKIGGCAGRIATDGVLELKSAKHPLLLLKLGKDRVVPLHIRMGDSLKSVVVTGPNAGGKTVALKTVGLMAMMHQHGLHIPAGEGSQLPLFSGIFADIGDKQSIEQDLSTFSSHIQSIQAILSKADSRSLVLLDEIGSATDPEEGSALARSVMKVLTNRGCLTLATTHMGALKIFAHETEGVENASMAFDQITLSPTYLFQMGIPGSSYAFEIAQRYGLQENLIREARAMIGPERGKLDRLLMDLEKESRRAHELLVHAEIQESRLSDMVILYQDKIARAREEGEKIRQAMIEDAEMILRETNKLAENVIREIRESKGDPEHLRSVRSAFEEHKKQIQSAKKQGPPSSNTTVHPDDWVAWEGHGGRAKVLSDPDGKGKVWIQWNDVRLQVPVVECRLIESDTGKRSVQTVVTLQADRSVGDEVDLRGMTAEEAIQALEKYLSDATMVGLTQVRIIHGKGTGVLRREVGKYLSGHKLVKNRRLGNWNEGDTGVTIVELK
jgi:DNA mismatch repair protein MutS2